MSSSRRVPVIALTGHLGAGKTTLLNHLLGQPGARVGVVVNDFGSIDVDAGLVSGQAGQPVPIGGGCLCCLDDGGGLDDALERLTHPRLDLDAVVVEASGLAETIALARMIRFSGVERVRLGGVVEVVDALEHLSTVDTSEEPPARFSAATLVAINKVDLLTSVLPARTAEEQLQRIEGRIRQVNPGVAVLRTSRGAIDPGLVFDPSRTDDPPDELPLAALQRRDSPPLASHSHATSVALAVDGPVDPAPLLDLLEDPPAGAYRIKGTVVIDTGRAWRTYVVHVVGRQVHVLPHHVGGRRSELVAIGMAMDVDLARSALGQALAPSVRPNVDGLRRLRRRRRLSE